MYRALTWLALERAASTSRTRRARALAEREPGRLRRRHRVLIARPRRHDGDPRAARSTTLCRSSRASSRPRGDARAPARARERGRRRHRGPRHRHRRRAGRGGEGLPRRRRGRARAAARAERPGIGADALATDLRVRDASDARRCSRPPTPSEIDTTELDVDEVVDRIEELVRRAAAGVNRVDAVWAVGRLTIGSAVRSSRPLRVYGASACRARAASCSRSTTSPGSTRPPSAPRRRARSTTWRRSRPPRAGLGS